MPIVILDEAWTDIREAHDWYERKRTGLGGEFELCIEDALERISNNPEASPVFHRNTRRLILARFPFGIFYRIIEDHLVIVALFHFKRDPRLLRKIIAKRKAI